MLPFLNKLFAPAPVPARPAPRGGVGPRHDLVALVGFAASAKLLVPPASAFDGRLHDAAFALPRQADGDATNLAAPLRLAADLLARRPCNHIGRLWLLTDGHPTVGEADIDRAVAAVAATRSNINTIGFGDAFDADRLRAIAAASHNGRFVTVQSLRQLTDAFLADHRPRRFTGQAIRPETTVIAVDLSASMTQATAGRTKIDVVSEALLRLLAQKQQFAAR